MSGRIDRQELVAVVIPAYNGEATIDETLRSVRSQTHSNLEILVVDDGSKDATTAIVERHAAADPRIRLISQKNGGVAAARNNGISQARADLIAFVDADDLWAPEKIRKQVAALRAGGDRCALVYTWYSLIDEESEVIDWNYRPSESGDVLERICFGNLVGNGSSALVTKEALIEVDGFDPGLRAQRAQGCEDLKLYFRIAERHHFALVPEYLTGYRSTPTNMSSDYRQMLRSRLLVAAEMEERQPQLKAAIRAGNAYYVQWLLERAMNTRRGGDFLFLAGWLAGRAPRLILQSFARPLKLRCRAMARKLLRPNRSAPAAAPSSPERFMIGEPAGAI
jgi:glycosyltransferase involved in cell wall biosynthesis